MEIEEEATDQGGAISARRERKPRILKAPDDESIDGVKVRAGRGDLSKGLEGPVFPTVDVRLEGGACQSKGDESGAQRKATM